ncbi:MAG: hypothetical protein SFW36_17820 [Leptolyngbyaceae cyanobacterium bins.59]|nr:hypothetical protein [Leptolyngbyaceae cyanobacterium bins.59]
MKQKLIDALNFLLMWDLFLVFLFFGWFAIAVLGKSMDFPLGLDLWYRLWQPMIQPAIGILMAGALLSGLVSWINKRFEASSLKE